MQYLSVQEFSKSPQTVLSSLSRKRMVVLTHRGKPSFFLIKTDDKSLEMLNDMLMQIECKKAIADIRAESKRNGNSKMSMKEINNIIAEVRADARKERKERKAYLKDNDSVDFRELDWFKKIRASMTPGGNLKLLLEVRQLSKKELSEKSGVATTRISDYESGKVKITKSVAKKLAKALDTAEANLYWQ